MSAKKTSFLQLTIISITISATLACQPSFGGRLLPIGKDWHDSISLAFGADNLTGNPLNSLHKIDGSISTTLMHRVPYKLTYPDGYIDLVESGFLTTLILPLNVNKQQVVLRFDVEDIKTEGHIEKPTSVFNLSDDSRTTSFTLAHNWKQVRLRWGVRFHWLHVGSENHFNPLWQIGWGEETDVSFTLLFGRTTYDNPWNWTLEDDEATGRIGVITDRVRFTARFGDPYGVQMKMVLEDDIYKNLTSSRPRKYNSGITGDRNRFSISVEQPTTNKIGWEIGGTHASISSEGTLRTDDDMVAQSPFWDGSLDYWGGEIRGIISTKTQWTFGTGYLNFSRDSRGWVFNDDLLPSGFSEVLSGDRLFIMDARYRGVELHGNSTLKLKHWSGKIETGYIDLSGNTKIEDFAASTDGTDSTPIRMTKLPVKDFSAVWVTIESEVRLHKLSLGSSVSQAFLVKHKLEEGIERTEGKLSGGYLVQMRITYYL